MIHRQLLEDAQRTAVEDAGTGSGGHCGASLTSSAVDLPRISTLRISHFPDSRSGRYAEPVDNRREPLRRTFDKARTSARPRTTSGRFGHFAR